MAFKRVCFKYPTQGRWTIDSLNLSIAQGEKVALVGESGSGKSTIACLLLGLYEPGQGEVELGFERSQYAFVAQEPALFNRSLLENIRYNSECTFEEVRHAAETAKALDFIENGHFGSALVDSEDSFCLASPQEEGEGQSGLDQSGFERRVGPRGCLLSGGQKQRVALARALVRRPQVLVLDEATSALDNESELAIKDALEHCRGMTQVIIAHRLSTIRHCDRIVVVGEGRILEEGTFEGLYQRRSHFYRLVEAIK